MSYDILRRELKEKKTRGLYLFYGPEEYLKRHYASEIEKLVIEPFAKDISYNMFEGKLDPGALYGACAAYPMFGDRRLVVLNNCNLFKPAQSGASKRGKGKNSVAGVSQFSLASSVEADGLIQIGNLNEISKDGDSDIGGVESGNDGVAGAEKQGGKKRVTIESVIDELPDFTCLLIIEQEIDKRLSLFKQVAAKGLVVEFAYRTPAELEDWVRAIAGRDRLQFTRDALRHFVGNAGETMTALRAELDKLLLYAAGSRGITIDDVNAVCSFSLKIKIFDLLDNVLAGQKRLAILELETLLKEREPAMRVLSTVSNHIVLLAHIKELAARGVRLPDATKQLGLNPYRAEKLWRQSARVTPETLFRAVELCNEQDVAIKTGKIKDIAALHMLVASI